MAALMRAAAFGVRGAAAARALPALSAVPVRGMASEKDIRKRIESTGSIKKITSSMKMVAAAKMRGAENTQKAGKSFGTVITKAAFPAQEDLEDPDVVAASGDHHLFIIVTSDRGLCGGVNSVVIRKLKAQTEAMTEAGKKFSVFCIGDKGKGACLRMFPDNFVGVVDQCYPKSGVTFPIAAGIAQRVMTVPFDSASITFNKFVSAIQYDTHTLLLTKLSADATEGSLDGTPEHLKGYDVEPEVKSDALDSLFEYSVSTTIFGCMLENAVSELSARMSAMDNASKNAGEMIEKLTLVYNRARQSRITTELIEIISGAESLKG